MTIDTYSTTRSDYGHQAAVEAFAAAECRDESHAAWDAAATAAWDAAAEEAEEKTEWEAERDGLEYDGLMEVWAD